MKVGILGAGGMGESVIQHLQQCAEVSAIAVLDRRQERVDQLGQQYGVQGTTNIADVLSDPAVRCVFITASNDAHAELAIPALKAGKAVMCEKPMANTLEDARLMVETAEATGAYLQIGFELRYSHLYARVKEWIDAGLLGDIINTQCTFISSAWPKGTWRTGTEGGSMFGEKLSHYVDLPRWWVGSPVTDVFTVCAPNLIPYYEVRDNYHTTYRFKNGAVSHLSFMMGPAATFEGDPLQDVLEQQLGDGHTLRFRIVGTLGAAETDVFARTLKRWKFGDSPQKMTSKWVETQTWTAGEDHTWHHNTCDQAHDIVRRVAAGLPPHTPARDAYETMRLCFAAEESADSGTIVRL